MRLTYSKVMSTAAVFLALGGTSYAAVAAIGSKEVRDGSLTGRDVKNGSLRAADFRKADLPRGERGPAGPQGVAGPQGLAGSQGPAGASGVVSLSYPTEALLVAPDQSAERTVECGPGQKVLGGGFRQAGGNDVDAQLIADGPQNDNAWVVDIRNLDRDGDNQTSLQADVYAVCAELRTG